MSSKSFQISYKSQEEREKALEMLSNRPEGMVIVDRPNKRVVYVDSEGIDGGMKKLMEAGSDTSRASRLMREAYSSNRRVIDIDSDNDSSDSDSSDSEEEDEIKSLFTRCSRGGIGGWCRNHISKVQYLKKNNLDANEVVWGGRIIDSDIMIEDSVPCNPPCVKRLRASKGWCFDSKCGCYWSEMREDLNEKKEAEAEAIRARAEALAEVLAMPAPEKPKKPLTAKQEQALATRRANAEKKKADKEREKFEAEAEKGRAKKQKEALAKQVKIEKAKRANQLKMAMKALGC
jgi:hypothetical protein